VVDAKLVIAINHSILWFLKSSKNVLKSRFYKLYFIS
jgi:hypothetical protein